MNAIFIERRNRDKIDLEIAKVAAELESGKNVSLYPEGTTTNGLEVVKFKRSFFDSALQVPLIIYIPELAQVNRCAENVSLVDLFPTVIDLTFSSGTLMDSAL